jgi:hypothetical protein
MFRLNRNKQKTNQQFDREHILLLFTENVGFFRFFFSFFFSLFRFISFFSVFSVCFKTVCFGCFASIPKQRVSIEPKQTEDPHPNSLKESIFGNFSENLGLFRFVTKQICLFRLFQYRLKHRNKPKFFLFGFTKQTETNTKQILFGFVSVRT